MTFRYLSYFVQLTLWWWGWWWWCLSGVYAGNLPEQIHLSLGTNETEMLVTWHTIDPITDKPEVYYGQSSNKLKQSSSAETIKFKEIVYTYRAMMVGLEADKVYYYKVGSKKSGWSTVYNFHTFKSGHNWNPKLCIYGDLGVELKESIPSLIRDVDRQLYDAILHAGDIAYDLDTNNGEYGNIFMRELEKIAARVPYMMAPGNHEQEDNFSHYDARFSMIGDRHRPDYKLPLSKRLSNHYHSFDIGRVHVLMYSTEYYGFTEYGLDQLVNQYHFMEQDLARANRNRLQVPWIIVIAHRPMYLFHLDDEWDNTQEIRMGLHWKEAGGERRYGVEELFNRFGVDLYLTGHEHFYLRMFPIYDRKLFWKIGVDNNTINNYHNSGGTVHIITGVAGKMEVIPVPKSTKKWVAFKTTKFGYTKLSVLDPKKILIEQLDLDGKVLDHLTMYKDNPIPNWPHYPPWDETQESDDDPIAIWIIVSLVFVMAVIGLLITIMVIRYQKKKLLQLKKEQSSKKSSPKNQSSSNKQMKNKISMPFTTSTTTSSIAATSSELSKKTSNNNNNEKQSSKIV